MLVNTKNTNRTIDTDEIQDYFSFDVKEVIRNIDSINSDYFDWYQLADDDKLERIALEIYGNADYWDILLLINGKDPLMGLPYNFDTLSAFADETVELYNSTVSTFSPLSESHKEYLKGIYEEKYRAENEANRVIRIVKPERLQEFIIMAYDLGYFK
jgi:hypothetical protein